MRIVFPMDFMVSCPKPAFPWKNLGANCVFPWISWSQKPQTCIPGKNQVALGCALCFPMVSWAQKPQTCIYLEKTYIRTWVRIVFSHGFRCNITQTANLHSLWQKPIGNLVGLGVVGWWGGGLCISNDLKRTSNGP